MVRSIQRWFMLLSLRGNVRQAKKWNFSFVSETEPLEMQSGSLGLVVLVKVSVNQCLVWLDNCLWQSYLYCVIIAWNDMFY